MNTRGTSRRLACAVAGVAAASMLLAGCGDDDATTTTGGNTTTSPAAGDEEPTGEEEISDGESVTVTETDFKLALSEDKYTAGPYVFTYENEGAAPHNLVVKGPGVDETSPTVQSGESGDLEVTLQKGTYTLWCGVGNHRDMGMETTIKVS